MRSPSPSYRDRRYRDDSPPPRRYPRDSRWDDGPRPGPGRRDDRDRNFRPDNRRWDDRRGYDTYSRDSRDDRKGSRSPYVRPRSPGPASSKGSPVKTSARSLTPEEGQITSPLPPVKPVARPRSPIRRRSPSPPRYRDRPYDRDRDQDRRDWSDRNTGRDWRGSDWRDRDRDHRGGWDRPGPSSYRYDRRDARDSRSPYHRRSPSPSELSSRSRSSRFTSPTKRSPIKASPRTFDSPVRDLSPDVPPRGPRSPPRQSVPPPSDRKLSPFPPPAPKLPPSGPRGDRAPPTGPRALSGGALRNTAYLGGPPPVKIERAPTPPPTEERVNINRSAPTASGSGPRLSWSERKSQVSPMDVKTLTPQRPRADSTSFAKHEPIMGASYMPVKEEKEVRPSVSDEERIILELEKMPNRYGLAQWEIDLNAHYNHMNTLAQHTNKARSAARIAAAVLADAEADRVAAAARSKTAQEQLQQASSWNASLLPI